MALVLLLAGGAAACAHVQPESRPAAAPVVDWSGAVGCPRPEAVLAQIAARIGVAPRSARG